MASNLTKWSALDTHIHAVTGVATTGMRNMAAAALILGPEIDNTAGYQYATPYFKTKGADTYHAGDYFAFWFIKAVDGTNYEDSGAEPVAPADLIIPVAASNAQLVPKAPLLVALPPCKFKVLAVNKTSHTTTDVDNETLLDLYRVSDDLITA